MDLALKELIRSFTSLVDLVMMVLISLQFSEPDYKVLMAIVVTMEKSLGNGEQNFVFYIGAFSEMRHGPRESLRTEASPSGSPIDETF